MDNILLKIRQSYPSMNTACKEIAHYILEHKEEIHGLSIDELADCCHTSTSAIVRFCKSLELSGYKELKAQLTTGLLEVHSMSSNPSEAMDITGREELSEIMTRVANNSIQAIRDTEQLMNEQVLHRVVNRISLASRVDFYGVGSSGLVALDACQKFIRIGKISFATSDVHIQTTMVTSLKPDDVAVIISYSGKTKDMLDIARFVREIGAYLLVITNYSQNNPLAAMADDVLYVASPETTLRSGATASRIAQMLVIDTIFCAVVSNDFYMYTNNIKKSYQMAYQIKYREDLQRQAPDNGDAYT